MSWSELDLTITLDENVIYPVSEQLNADNTLNVELGKISGTFIFIVCEKGTDNCSNEATVVI